MSSRFRASISACRPDRPGDRRRAGRGCAVRPEHPRTEAQRRPGLAPASSAPRRPRCPVLQPADVDTWHVQPSTVGARDDDPDPESRTPQGVRRLPARPLGFGRAARLPQVPHARLCVLWPRVRGPCSDRGHSARWCGGCQPIGVARGVHQPRRPGVKRPGPHQGPRPPGLCPRSRTGARLAIPPVRRRWCRTWPIPRRRRPSGSGRRSRATSRPRCPRGESSRTRGPAANRGRTCGE